MMRRLLATGLTLWAVLLVALVLAVSRHQPATTSAAQQQPTVVLVRSQSGKLTPVVLPAQTTTHATTRTS
jgi:hypothetical protein